MFWFSILRQTNQDCNPVQLLQSWKMLCQTLPRSFICLVMVLCLSLPVSSLYFCETVQKLGVDHDEKILPRAPYAEHVHQFCFSAVTSSMSQQQVSVSSTLGVILHKSATAVGSKNAQMPQEQPGNLLLTVLSCTSVQLEKQWWGKCINQ